MYFTSLIILLIGVKGTAHLSLYCHMKFHFKPLEYSKENLGS